MGESQSQQLTSFYVSVFIIAIITVWALSSGTSQQKINHGRILCLAYAKPEFNLKIRFNLQQITKNSSATGISAYPFRIISIINKSSSYCRKKLGEIIPVYLKKSQQVKLHNKPRVPLKLILFANASLIKRTGATVWKLNNN